ncbi:MAG TPA: diguanylate cyclase [Rhodospirillaceae bacterium]|nr:diguanylate cyclase [Rhodospirillaceae bacterium]
MSVLKILIVSKDALFARVARSRLAAMGHAVQIEDDLAGAVKRCRLDPFRLVVVDFDLPDGGGRQLCRDLRSLARVEHLYLLGYGSDTSKDGMLSAQEAGADAYAHKPLHAGELRFCMQQADRLLSLSGALQIQSGEDLVTGLLSATSFKRFFSNLYAQYRRNNGRGALMFIDVVNMTDIVRTCGAEGSNAVDRAVAARLSLLPRTSDIVAKMADGEFCVVLTGTSSLQCEAIALRVAEALTDLDVTLGDEILHPRLTIAIADFPIPQHNASEMLQTAPRTIIAHVGPGTKPTDNLTPTIL